MARAFHGPVLIPTPAEVALIRDAMYGRRDPLALALIHKCDAVLERAPRPVRTENA